MLEAELVGRVRIVGALPAGVQLKDVELAGGAEGPAYEPIRFPVIERTADLPEVVGAFHDPAFARQAFEFLASKDAMTMDEYVSLAEDLRAKAFTISGETNTELLTGVKDALAEVVKTGGTQADFASKTREVFEAFGVTELNPWRTKLIFDTNVAQAYSDGEWRQLHEPGVLDAFPFIRYRARMERTRDSHAWMNGRVYRSDDPLWEEWRPPNGFNCHCWLEYIGHAEAEANGITADTLRPETFGIHPDPGFGAGEKAA